MAAQASQDSYVSFPFFVFFGLWLNDKLKSFISYPVLPLPKEWSMKASLIIHVHWLSTPLVIVAYVQATLDSTRKGRTLDFTWFYFVSKFSSFNLAQMELVLFLYCKCLLLCFVLPNCVVPTTWLYFFPLIPLVHLLLLFLLECCVNFVKNSIIFYRILLVILIQDSQEDTSWINASVSLWHKDKSRDKERDKGGENRVPIWARE